MCCYYIHRLPATENEVTVLSSKFQYFFFHFSLNLAVCPLCVLKLLTNHYEQNWKFYCLPSGWGSYGTASEDELLLTKKIFWGVFDSLSQRVRRVLFLLYQGSLYCVH